MSAIDVLANDTDGGDGGPMTVDTLTQPVGGTVEITGSGTGVSYAPDSDFCTDPPGDAPDTFTYALNGGSTATVPDRSSSPPGRSPRTTAERS